MTQIFLVTASVCEALFTLCLLAAVIYIAVLQKKSDGKAAKTKDRRTKEKADEMSVEERRLTAELENIDNYATNRAQKDIV